MSTQPTAASALSARRHVAGSALVLCAIAAVGLVSFLPTRGATGLELPFLDESGPPVVVAFAGFPGCGTICPTSLALLGRAHDALDADARQRVGLLFINVQRGGHADVSRRYARAFHRDFAAWTVTADSAAAVHDKLALPSYADPARASEHSGSIYVFARERGAWRIAHVWRRTPGRDGLVARLDDITKSIERTS